MVYTKKRIFIVVLALLVCLATAVWADGQDEAAAAGKVELDFDTHMYNYEPWNAMIENVVDKCVRVRISTVWSNVVRFTFLALATLAVAFPLYWVAATSLKTHAEAMSVPPTWFPEIPTFRTTCCN